jgi:hypothetical protein
MQPALQDLKRETDTVASIAVAGAVGAIHIFANIGGGRLIQVDLFGPERVAGGIRLTRRACCVGLSRKSCTAWTVRRSSSRSAGPMDALAESVFETIGVEQPHRGGDRVGIDLAHHLDVALCRAATLDQRALVADLDRSARRNVLCVGTEELLRGAEGMGDTLALLTRVVFGGIVVA